MQYKFVAVMKTDNDGRIAKRADFTTMAEAQAHADKFREMYPDAFVAPIPTENEYDWKIDSKGKRVSIDKRPQPATPPAPENLNVKIGALEARIAALEAR